MNDTDIFKIIKVTGICLLTLLAYYLTPGILTATQKVHRIWNCPPAGIFFLKKNDLIKIGIVKY